MFEPEGLPVSLHEDTAGGDCALTEQLRSSVNHEHACA